MNRTSARRIAVPGIAALALTLTLSACGAGNESSGSTEASDGESLSGTLAGAGASSMETAQSAWITTYQGQNPDVTITYDPVGSGDGRTQFISGGVSFAGSDAYLDDDEGELSAAQERCAGEPVIEIPAYVSPIALIYNVEGVDDLTLDAPTAGAIFAGDIDSWDDPAIADLNPDAELPSSRIVPVHRADDSGTTENFTDWMFQASDGSWSDEADGVWPIQGGEAGNGTAGVISAVTNGANTIGYADLSQAGELPVANVEIGGESLTPSAEAAASILEASDRVEDREDVDMAYDINRDPEAGAYPIVLLSYVLACQSYEDATEADLVRSYLTYVVSEDGQAAAAEEAGSAPLSEGIAEEATGILEGISAQN